MSRLSDAFAAEEYQGLRLMTFARLVILAIIAAWIPFENGYPAVLYYQGLIAVFAVLSIAPLALHRAGLHASWQDYIFPFLDVTLFTIAVLIPNPLQGEAFPPQMRLRFGNEMYLLVFLPAALFTYSPRVVMWTGIVTAAVWAAGTLWIFHLPSTAATLWRSDWDGMTPAQQIAAVLDPHRVNEGLLGRQVLLILLVSGMLTVIGRRSRRLVLRQVAVERERSNLSRYFSPNMVEELAQSDQPLGATRQQNVAVLFVDIVGFTRFSAARSPQEIIDLLRQFQRLVAQAVFDHGGTLDKYLGDGAMATFGTPRTGPRDATNALRCARDLLQRIADWNRERAAHKQPSIRIGIGLHYGPVILGDIGDERHLEFAVLGDTVNVASRIEELTRPHGADLIVSQALLEAARAEGSLDATDTAGLQPLPSQQVRGRDEPIEILRLQGGRTSA